ncbi:hypothetical protein L218DRAFT_403215 [Marasmius fiardii PR-910]|nr:hypothetical protein L218DRAFT_403215 [Marasmius fiardii PR-910]
MLVSDDGSTEEGSSTQSVPLNLFSAPPTINTIPVEILTDIFRYFQPEAFFPVPDIPPLVHLICVCRHWRIVALNAPSLWSTIALRNPKHFHIAMVRQWLERSKTCPLTLSVTLHDFEVPAWEVVVGRAEKILQMFRLHLRRWKSIYLDIMNFPIHSQSPLVNLPISQAAPLLEEVDVCHRKSFTFHASKAFWEAISTYPSVRRVAWTEGIRAEKTYLPSVLSVTRLNLTHIASRFVVDDDFMALLSGCPTLEVLHILSLHPPTSVLNTCRRICLSSLHEIDCSASPATLLSQLLERLEVPNLNSLTLDEFCDPWIELLERSSCRLRSLSVQLQGSSYTDIQDLFMSSSMMYLEELDACRFCSADSLLQNLTWKQGTNSLPLLQRLELVVGDYQDGLVSTMLRSRLQSSSHLLGKISLHLSQSLIDSSASVDAQFLQNLRMDGLDLQFHF